MKKFLPFVLPNISIIWIQRNFIALTPGDLDHRPGGHEESGGWTIVMGATMCIPQLDRAMPSGVKAQSLQLLHQSIE
jgi:hypothetical protein